MTLKEKFLQLVSAHTASEEQAAQLWNNIEKSYSGHGRHYHTLHHLEDLLENFEANRHRIKNWDAVLFALFYHDIIYNPLKSNNEEKSAQFAEKTLNTLNVPKQTIAACSRIILATKKHEKSNDDDINLFTDVDLAILGQSPDIYEIYSNQVRKEYGIFPDLVYNAGRKKVLARFLNADRIFKTDHFFDAFEAQARKNLKKEFYRLK